MALRDHFDRRYMIGAADGPFPHGASQDNNVTVEDRLN